MKICLTVLQLVWRRSLDFSIACSTRQDFQRSFLIEEKAPFSPIYTLIHGILSLYSSDHANWAIRRLLLIISLHRFFFRYFCGRSPNLLFCFQSRGLVVAVLACPRHLIQCIYYALCRTERHLNFYEKFFCIFLHRLLKTSCF